MATALEIALAQAGSLEAAGGIERIAAMASAAELQALQMRAKGVEVFYKRCDSCGSAIWYPVRCTNTPRERTSGLPTPD